MPTDWEMDVHIELNAMSQSDNQSFCDFAVTFQNKNGLLKNPELHLDDTCLCTHIEVGMDLALNKMFSPITQEVSLGQGTSSLNQGCEGTRQHPPDGLC